MLRAHMIRLIFNQGLFVNVVQTSDVITVVFDVLAIQCLESIDDVAFNLAKRGFFGGRMMEATRKVHTVRTIGNGGLASKSWIYRIARGMYYLNAIVLLSGVVVISSKQLDGDYRCRKMMVTFEEVIWEEANVILPNNTEARLLIYSWFNGIYEEEGLFGGE